MSAAFWNNALIAIYFVYGLAFYSLGLALLVESGRSSELGFARSMRLLAAFGLLHGLHEWLDMMRQTCDCFLNIQVPNVLSWMQLIILVTSFIALAGFGEQLSAREVNKQTPSWKLTLGLLLFYSISGILVQWVYRLQDEEWRIALDVLARYTIGIPAALIAARALWHQHNSFIERGLGKFASWMVVASIALFFYGTVGQIFTPESIVFPANWLNNVLFLERLGFPIQLLRALLACVIAVAMIQVLRSLEVENEQRLAAIADVQRIMELEQNRKLAQLNTELIEANAASEKLLEDLKERDSLRAQWLQRITAAQEAERQRIARELHDDTGQVLTGLSMALRGLKHIIEQNPQKAQEKLGDLERMATSAIQDLRHLINDLRPPQLDDMGLISALRSMKERMNEANHGKVVIHLNVDGDMPKMSSEIEISLFRIAQEAVTNALKHAEAKNIYLNLDFRESPCLCVKDDGKGFNAEQALNPNSLRMAWGLYGIRERAKLIDADLLIESQVGTGTRILLSLGKTGLKEVECEHPNFDGG